MSCNCFAKCYVMISAIIVTLIGIAVIAVGIGHSKSKNPQNIYTKEMKSNQDGLYAVIIIIGFLFTFFGIMGLVSLWEQRQCARKVYKFGNYVFLALFLIMAIIAIAVTRVMANKMKDPNECASNKMCKSANDFYLAGQNLFCSNNCMCYLPYPGNYN